MAVKKLIQTVASKKNSVKFYGADDASVQAVGECLLGECAIFDRVGTVGSEADGKTTPPAYNTGLFQFKNTATGSVGYWNVPYGKATKTIEEISAAIKANMKCPDGTTPDEVQALGYRSEGA